MKVNSQFQQTLLGCLHDDADAVVDKLKTKYSRDFKCTTSSCCNTDSEGNYYYNALFEDINSGDSVETNFQYIVESNEIVSYGTPEEIADEIMQNIQGIQSSDITEGSYISAAADDEDTDFDQDISFDDNDVYTDDEALNDTLDEMSDQLDNMQDQLEDIQEDDPSIQVDNNIENHYIVECDKCHGVFISSIIESDASIEKISGRCPLCGKDSEQYLKWIIRSVDYEEPEDTF